MARCISNSIGYILAQAELLIQGNDTTARLSSKLSSLGAALLIDTIKDYVDGNLTPIKQDAEEATLTRMIKKEDGELDLYQSAEFLERKIRAYNPWPICFLNWNSNILRIYEAEISKHQDLKPSQRGEIDKFPAVGTATNSLIFKVVQPSGKKVMNGRSFLNGAKYWGEK